MDIHNLNTATVGGVDLLPLLDGFPTLRIPNELRDVSRINRRGVSQQNVKRELSLSTTVRSEVSTGVFVSHLSVGAFALDGGSQIVNLRSMSLNGSYQSSNIPTVGSLWRSRRNRRLQFETEVQLGMPDAGGLALALQAGGTIADQVMDFSVTINSVAYTLPIIVREWEIGEDDGEEVVTVRGDGNDPGSGAYPASPTTSTTLLLAAMNAFNAPLAFEVETGGAGNGINASGNVKFNTFGFEVRDEELITIDYEFLSHGAVTIAVAA